jgi:hypothetical protein
MQSLRLGLTVGIFLQNERKGGKRNNRYINPFRTRLRIGLVFFSPRWRPWRIPITTITSAPTTITLPTRRRSRSMDDETKQSRLVSGALMRGSRKWNGRRFISERLVWTMFVSNSEDITMVLSSILLHCRVGSLYGRRFGRQAASCHEMMASGVLSAILPYTRS